MNSTTKTITDIEYKSLEGFQKKFYSRKAGSKKTVPLKYYYNPQKESWNNHISVKLGVERADGNQSHYEFSKLYSYISRLYSVIKLPEIKVAKEYQSIVRIAYTPNLAHHIHGKAGFHAGDGLCQSITPSSLDDYRVTHIKNIKDYDHGIGNIPELQDFSDRLPPKILKFFPPWFFNLNKKLVFPLYEECLENGKIYLMHEYNLDISKLIRVEAIIGEDGKEFKPVKFKMEYLEVDTPLKIKTPEVWCIYANISDDEKNFRINNKKNNVIDYVDIIEIPHNDYKQLGDNLSIILNSSLPVMGISWKAINRQSELKNNHSNYTTNVDNLKLGHNPIYMSELKYGNLVRVSPREHYHFDEIYPRIYFGHTPYDKGYNFYYYDYEPTTLSNGHTVVFDKMSNSSVMLNCTLDDTSEVRYENIRHKKKIISDLVNDAPKKLYIQDEESQKKNSPQFKVIATLYVKKRLIFDKKTKKFFVIGDKLSYDNYIDAKSRK